LYLPFKFYRLPFLPIHSYYLNHLNHLPPPQSCSFLVLSRFWQSHEFQSMVFQMKCSFLSYIFVLSIRVFSKSYIDHYICDIKKNCLFRLYPSHSILISDLQCGYKGQLIIINCPQIFLKVILKHVSHGVLEDHIVMSRFYGRYNDWRFQDNRYLMTIQYLN